MRMVRRSRSQAGGARRANTCGFHPAVQRQRRVARSLVRPAFAPHRIECWDGEDSNYCHHAYNVNHQPVTLACYGQRLRCGTGCRPKAYDRSASLRIKCRLRSFSRQLRANGGLIASACHGRTAAHRTSGAQVLSRPVAWPETLRNDPTWGGLAVIAPTESTTMADKDLR